MAKILLIHISCHHIYFSESVTVKQCTDESAEIPGIKFDPSGIEKLCEHLNAREHSKIEPGKITEADLELFESFSSTSSDDMGDGLKRKRRQAQLVRKEYRLMSKNEREKFERAVWGLTQTGQTPIYDVFHSLHHYSQSPGAHRGAAFIGWHREFLSR